MAAALCLSSASAVEVYDLEPDAQLFSLNSGVSTLAASDSWYDSVLQNLQWIMFDITDIHSALDATSDDSLYNQITKLVDASNYLGNISDWLGATPSLGNEYSLYQLLSWIDDSTTSMVGQLFDLDTELSLFRSGWSSALTVPAGTTIVNSAGFAAEASSDRSLVQMLNLAFRGFSSQLTTGSNNLYLDASGSRATTSGNITFANLVRRGFLGLSSNIGAQTTQLGVDLDEQTQQLSGDLHQISDGEYGVDLFDSDTGSSDMLIRQYPTMGDMLQAYLAAMQWDLGALTFLYADEETIQAKKDAAENISAADEGFLAPDSVGGISADSLGDAADAVGGTKELFDTGVSVGQAFEQLQGSGPLEFFTSVTASNLDTVPATASEDDDDFVHFYDPTNSEFFELIGKGAD